MTQRFRLAVFLLSLLFAAPAAFAQTTTGTSAVPSAESVQVQGLAPQLIPFAGSTQNFQSLVDGLTSGQPVTLVTQTPDGFTQTVTFTPVGTLTPLQIAQTLEAARQQLISRGIAAPTAQQIGITLAGGSLATNAGTVPVTGLVPVINGSTPSASTGASTAGSVAPTVNASARAPATALGTTPLGAATTTPATGSAVTTTTAPTGGLMVQVTPGPSPVIGAAAPAAATTSSTTTTTPAPRFTSDTPTQQNLSNSPTPSIGAAASPSTPNGLPSPAAQLQQRR
jgi:hypothetical protein